MKLFPKQSIMLSLFVLMFMLLSVLTVVIPHAFGFTMAIVTSDAMEPTYSKGTLLFVKNASEDNLVVGNEVTYYVDQGRQMRTRRIVAVAENQSVLYTIGDNQNQMEPKEIQKSQVIGQPIFYIPKVGAWLNQTTIQLFKNMYLLFALYILATTLFVTFYQIKSGSVKKTITSSYINKDKETAGFLCLFLSVLIIG